MELDLKKLKAQANKLEALLQVGKAGVTEALLAELARQLKKEKLVKIKLAKESLDPNVSSKKARQTMAKKLCDKTGAVLIHLVGFTAVLYKK